jgi:hypothetical protein
MKFWTAACRANIAPWSLRDMRHGKLHKIIEVLSSDLIYTSPRFSRILRGNRRLPYCPILYKYISAAVQCCS